MKRILTFIVSHSLFAALCAASLGYETYLLSGLQPNVSVLLFVFCSTVASYNFYWLLSKFAYNNSRGLLQFLKRNAANLAFIAISGAFALLIAVNSMQEVIYFILIAVFLTLLYAIPILYSSLEKLFRVIGFFKAILLAATWTYVTALLPLIHAGESASIYLIAARFFFMLTLCIVFDKKDILADRRHHLHSIATDLPLKTVSLYSTISILSYGFFYFLWIQNSGNTFLYLSLLVVLASLFIVLRLSYKKQGFYFYYVVVDGLMIWSAFNSFIFMLF